MDYDRPGTFRNVSGRIGTWHPSSRCLTRTTLRIVRLRPSLRNDGQSTLQEWPWAAQDADMTAFSSRSGGGFFECCTWKARA